MKKLVIAFVVIAVLAVIGYFLFLKPVPEAFTPESVGKMALSSCSKDLQDLVLLLEAVESDETKCEKIDFDVLKYYCFAWFGRDFCSSLEDEKSCRAVLQRNPADCDTDVCFGILGSESGCSDPVCVAVARRDKAGLSDPALCDVQVEKAKERASCMQLAKSVQELEACRLANS